MIEELERSQKHMENMKRHYEEKLDCLFMKMKATEQERDKVLGTLTSGKRSAQVNAGMVFYDWIIDGDLWFGDD